jgi:hypothetical protein
MTSYLKSRLMISNLQVLIQNIRNRAAKSFDWPKQGLRLLRCTLIRILETQIPTSRSRRRVTMFWGSEASRKYKSYWAGNANSQSGNKCTSSILVSLALRKKGRYCSRRRIVKHQFSRKTYSHYFQFYQRINRERRNKGSHLSSQWVLCLFYSQRVFLKAK